MRVEYFFRMPLRPTKIKEKLVKHNLEQVLFNLPAGDWDAGDRYRGRPSTSRRVSAGVPKAIAYAKALGCTRELFGRDSSARCDPTRRAIGVCD